MTSILGCLRTQASPSRVPARICGRSNSSSGKNSETRIASNPIRTARKLTELTRKQMPAPATRMTPATAGPKMRDALNSVELSAIAFGRSSRPTIR